MSPRTNHGIGALFPLLISHSANRLELSHDTHPLRFFAQVFRTVHVSPHEGIRCPRPVQNFRASPPSCSPHWPAARHRAPRPLRPTPPKKSKSNKTRTPRSAPKKKKH